ncbi:MAG TPA: nitrilase-related carbon-nitrogen hydrolase [Fimbriimonadaceae bacterium]|nr:nitrilase-related carbon-nitrogen hydrolase [Fimbriimonadaceae bacterium]HRJ95572.1 nitrilase-related carbon-nitrogen hydrolase [Fimbriimonadaceae bacterium]
MRVAAAAWKLRPIKEPADFFAHLDEFFRRAVAEAADWLVLPELPVLELLHLHSGIAETSAPAVLAGYAVAYEEALVEFSSRTGISVVGGSHFEGEPVRHVSAIVEMGRVVRQTKNKTTGYERTPWGLGPGDGLRRLADPRVGVLVCYDSEFPEAVRVLAEAGVLALMVPAFTETRRGFQRVRWCCQARAVENQIFVVHASLVGDLGGEPVPSTFGSSAILTPSHESFLETAILAETPVGEEGLAVADLDFSLLSKCRSAGDVRNWSDRDPSVWRLLP